MATRYRAVISEADYAEFKRLVPDLPEGIGGWEFERDRRRHGTINYHEVVIDVPVKPADFQKACQEGRYEPTLDGIIDFGVNAGFSSH